MHATLFTGDALDQITARVISNTQSETANVLDQRTASRLQHRQDAHKHKFQVTLDVDLDDDALTAIENKYREFKILHDIRAVHTHGMSQACRIMEHHYCLHFLGSHHSRVCDLGGNPSLNVLLSDNIHTCFYVNDGRAAARNEFHMQRLRRTAANPSAACGRRARVALRTPVNQFLCNLPGEKCTHPVDGIMLCHVAYDMSVSAQCRAMIQHGARRLVGCFLFDNQMIVQDKGDCDDQPFSWDIQTQYCKWRHNQPRPQVASKSAFFSRARVREFIAEVKQDFKDSVKNRFDRVDRYFDVSERNADHPLGWEPCDPDDCVGHRVIYYYFRDDPSLGYKHSFINLMEHMTKTAYYVAGQFFQLELLTNRLGTQFYSITRVGGNIPATVYTHRIQLPKMRNQTVVRCFDFIYHHSEGRQLQTKLKMFPTYIFDAGFTYVMEPPNGKLKLNDLVTFLSGVNNQQINNGVTITYKKKLNAQQTLDLSLALFFLGCVHQLERDGIMKNLEAILTRKREVALSHCWSFSTWSKGLWCWVKQRLGRLKTPESQPIEFEEKYKGPTYSKLTKLIATAEGWDEMLPFFMAAKTEITFEELFQAQETRERPYVSDVYGNIWRPSPDLSDLDQAHLLLSQCERSPSIVPDDLAREIRPVLLAELLATCDEDLYMELTHYSCSFGPFLLGIPEYFSFSHLPVPEGYTRGNTLYHWPHVDWPVDSADKTVSAAAVCSVVVPMYLKGQWRLLASTLDSVDCDLLPQLDLPWLRELSFHQLIAPHSASLARKLSVDVNHQSPDLAAAIVVLNRHSKSVRDDIKELLFPGVLTKFVRKKISGTWRVSYFIGRELAHQIATPANMFFIGEDPGYFCQAFHDVFPVVPQTVSSLAPWVGDHGLPTAAFLAADKWLAGFGDVTKPCFSDNLPNFDFICCDASARGSYRLNTDLHCGILDSALDVVRRVLTPGGTLVIKTYSLCTPATQEWLKQICSLFKVRIVKPYSSWAHRPDRYVIGSHFRCDKTNFEALNKISLAIDRVHLRGVKKFHTQIATGVFEPFENSPQHWCSEFMRDYDLACAANTSVPALPPPPVPLVIPSSSIPLPPPPPWVATVSIPLVDLFDEICIRRGDLKPIPVIPVPPPPPPVIVELVPKTTRKWFSTYLAPEACFLQSKGDSQINPPYLVYAFPGSGKSTFARSLTCTWADTDDLEKQYGKNQDNWVIPPVDIVFTNYYHKDFIRTFVALGFTPMAVRLPFSRWLKQFTGRDGFPAPHWFKWWHEARLEKLELLFPVVAGDFCCLPGIDNTVHSFTWPGASPPGAKPIPCPHRPSSKRVRLLDAPKAPADIPIALVSEVPAVALFVPPPLPPKPQHQKSKKKKNKTITTKPTIPAQKPFSPPLVVDPQKTDPAIVATPPGPATQISPAQTQKNNVQHAVLSSVVIPQIHSAPVPIPPALPPPLKSSAKVAVRSRFVDRAPQRDLETIYLGDMLAHMDKRVLHNLADGQLNGEMAEPLVLLAVSDRFAFQCSWYEVGLRQLYTCGGKDEPVIFVYNQHAYFGVKEKTGHMLEKIIAPDFNCGVISATADGDCVYHALRHYCRRLPPVQDLRRDVADYLHKCRPTAGGSKVQAATNELLRYWEAETKAVSDYCAVAFSEMLPGGRPSPYKQQVWYKLDECVLLQRFKPPGKDTFIYRPHSYDTSGEYDCFYDGHEFLKGNEVSGGYVVESVQPYLLVCRHLRLFQAPRLRGAIQETSVPGCLPTLAHIGVPGAGKTHAIITGCQTGDLILAGCRKSIEDAAEELKLKRPDVKVDARTADSYLINKQTKHRVVWLDERYALHAGYLGLIAAHTECEVLHTFGDPNQIPCYSRIAGFHFLHNDVGDTNVVYEAVSKRVPMDVAQLLAPYYTKYGKFQTMNPKKKSLTFSKITSIADITPDESVQYITWTQDEKKRISKVRGFSNVKTIGESQGITQRDTVLIRLNPRTLALFTKREQAIVALSRHTNSFKYYSVTAQSSDMVYKLIHSPKVGQLASYLRPDHFPETWLAPKAGGVRVEKVPVCFRPGARELHETYYYNNLHLPHKARRFTKLVTDKLRPTLPTFHTAPAYGLNGIQAALQRDYESAMDVPVSFNEKYHNYLISRGDIEFNIPDSTVKHFRARPKIFGNEQLNTFSRLRTLQPWPRPTTDRQLMLAIEKRNCNVLRYAAPVDPYAQAEEIADYFFDTYCVQDWRKASEGFCNSQVAVDHEAIDDYLITCEPSKLRVLQEVRLKGSTPGSFRLDPWELDHYNLIFKREPKNRLQRDGIGEYQILQTVIHHEAKVNIICSFFRQLYDRLQTLLKPNVFVQLKKSIDDLEQHLNEHVPPGALPFENDFEKFDKSQLLETFAVELAIYRRLGLNIDLLILWVYGQTLKTAANFLLGIRVALLFQRTSGTVVTAFGNVIVNMAATAWAYKLKEILFFAVYFVGDDSLVFPFTMPDIFTVQQDLQLFFNLLGKVIVGLGNYFCSCFFVHDGNRWLVYPDPVKRIERLSYPLNLNNISEIHDRWLSFRDMCRNYYNAAGNVELQRQVRIRYPGSTVVNAMRAIVSLMDDFDAFQGLYNRN